MPIDAGLAAMLVRATARVSAVILSVGLFVAARRIRARDGRAAHANEMRRLDVAAFAAFIASQTIHFICVGLLTIAAAGANIDGPGGYPAVIAVGLLFYAACAAVLRSKQRPAAGWADERQWHREV